MTRGIQSAVLICIQNNHMLEKQTVYTGAHLRADSDKNGDLSVLKRGLSVALQHSTNLALA
ncbi:MAG: hypothetical protein ACI82A_001619 [Candidatus Azotimanducaceae bacterium]|jgi:hypothetical protein